MDRVSKYAQQTYQKVAEPYKRLWNCDWPLKSNLIVAIAIPVITALGIPFSVGFIFSGLTFSDYWSAVYGGAKSVVDKGVELKDRAVWECGPGLAACYIVQPNGWNLNDMESMESLAGLARKSTGGVPTLRILPEQLPIAHFDWFSPLMENPALILPSRL